MTGVKLTIDPSGRVEIEVAGARAAFDDRGLHTVLALTADLQVHIDGSAKWRDDFAALTAEQRVYIMRSLTHVIRTLARSALVSRSDVEVSETAPGQVAVATQPSHGGDVWHTTMISERVL